MYPHPSSHLIGLGEYTAVSEAIISVSSCGRFGFDSSSFALSVVDPTSLLGDVDFFSSFNLFSSPSTLFNNASSTIHYSASASTYSRGPLSHLYPKTPLRYLTTYPTYPTEPTEPTHATSVQTRAPVHPSAPQTRWYSAVPLVPTVPGPGQPNHLLLDPRGPLIISPVLLYPKWLPTDTVL